MTSPGSQPSSSAPRHRRPRPNGTNIFLQRKKSRFHTQSRPASAITGTKPACETDDLEAALLAEFQAQEHASLSASRANSSINNNASQVEKSRPGEEGMSATTAPPQASTSFSQPIPDPLAIWSTSFITWRGEKRFLKVGESFGAARLRLAEEEPKTSSDAAARATLDAARVEASLPMPTPPGTPAAPQVSPSLSKKVTTSRTPTIAKVVKKPVFRDAVKDAIAYAKAVEAGEHVPDESTRGQDYFFRAILVSISQEDPKENHILGLLTHCAECTPEAHAGRSRNSNQDLSQDVQ